MESTARSVGATGERKNGNGQSLAEQVSEQAQAVAGQVGEQASHVAEQAQELGSQAIDGVDEWLRPVGLSLRDKPVMTLAVLGAGAAIVGAIFMSRSQRTTMQAAMDHLSGLTRRSGW